ncbi:hypothetical protein H0H92_013580 [Tricholoma furcatifolium]|nr:hypothetical protein H0H92_013580 [Tricholoma furcatifolium]
MSMKDRHYWAQLRLALTSGQWASKYPAKAPNGTALPWSELLRKFNKHCRGFQDVAQVASHTQALALLLAANSRDEDQDDAPVDGIYPLELGSECMLPEERLEEAGASYDALLALKSSNFDSLNFVLAYYAYALGNPSQCLTHLSNIPEIMSLPNHIPSESDSSTRASTTTGHTHHHLHVPTFSTSQSFSSAAASTASLTDSSSPDIKDGRAWAMTETLRSICLQGMSHEKLSNTNPHEAIAAYRTALPLLSTLGSILSDPSASMVNSKTFLQHRELWRWVERLIWRAIVVSASTSNPEEDNLWTWLHQYAACAVYWPATFRTWHRSTISVIYLTATTLRYHPVHSLTPTSASGDKGWLHSARTVINDYRAVLGACTSFPTAGERNTRVEDFVDLSMCVWEANGAHGDGAGWVIDILWWATRLTFNSHRILRHMTRVLHVAGDTMLARRTLLLYSQVVEKAYEAHHANTPTNPSSTNSSSGDLNAETDDDADSDRAWVETLVSGARMLCRWAAAQPGLEGLKEVREAGEYIQKARTRLSPVASGPEGIRLVARVDLAEGIWNVLMNLKEQDPHTRPGRLADAHEFFLRACLETYSEEEGKPAFAPDPAALFHLALSFAHPGPQHDLEQAIVHAGRAVEADPREIRYWHLLGLLLAAAEKWNEAREILESGAVISEDESSKNHGQVNGDVAPQATPVILKGDRITLLNGIMLPPFATLLAPVQDHPPPSNDELFEYALQLRMTQGVLTEVIDGAEGAEEKWLDVFSWVAAQRTPSVGHHTPRTSVDGSQAIAEKAPSFNALNEKQDTLDPIPINISPATPEADTPILPGKRLSLSTKRSSSIDRDASKSKKMQQMLKNRVHQGRARVSTISKKIGNGVVRTGSLKRPNSTPDFHAILRQTSYQASSIHSRRRISSFLNNADDRTPTESPPPPPVPIPPPPPPQEKKRNVRAAHRDRLIANLWLMSAATFRRLGKIEQAKGAIQEAEVKDEGNPTVWVQLGLYYIALGQHEQAVDAYQKALFIDPDDVAASVHLARLFLSRHHMQPGNHSGSASSVNVDLAAGMLGHLTRGSGWDVPEAWYYLAKAYGLQGRKERERGCLDFALALSGTRGIREASAAVGWCI